ncbi:MAG: hypothetical protein IPN32_32215 [Deltaproteobacteria bacterium]|nr:hypothetical protein [Deltaproteobacteria bacterium]
MSMKGRVFRLLGPLLRDAEIIGVTAPEPSFRLVRLAVRGGGGARWSAGDKLQVLMPSDDVRTYTPLWWGPDGGTALLVYARGDTPASRWARTLEPGARVRLAGPARSLAMPPGPLTLVGDETSIAVAASYARARPGQVRAWIEVAQGVAVARAIAATGLEEVELVERPMGAARGETLARALPQLAGAVGITGAADLVQRVRDELRGRGVGELRTKAYWIDGRVGLD